MASPMSPGTYGFLAGVLDGFGIVLMHTSASGQVTTKEIAEPVQMPAEHLPVTTQSAVILSTFAVFAACEHALRALRPGTRITLVHTFPDLEAALDTPMAIVHPTLEAPLARIKALIAEAHLTVAHHCSEDRSDVPGLQETMIQAETLALSAPSVLVAPLAVPVTLGPAALPLGPAAPVPMPPPVAAALEAALQQRNLNGAMHPARFADTVSTCWLHALGQRGSAFNESLYAQLLTLARQAAAAGRAVEYAPATREVSVSRKAVRSVVVRWRSQFLETLFGWSKELTSEHLLALCKSQETVNPTQAGDLIDLTLAAKWTLDHGLNVSWA